MQPVPVTQPASNPFESSKKAPANRAHTRREFVAPVSRPAVAGVSRPALAVFTARKKTRLAGSFVSVVYRRFRPRWKKLGAPSIGRLCFCPMGGSPSNPLGMSRFVDLTFLFLFGIKLCPIHRTSLSLSDGWESAELHRCVWFC